MTLLNHSLFLRIASAILVAPVVAMPSVAEAQRTTPAAVTARNEMIVRDAFRRWAAGEAIFPTLLADDVVWTIPGSGPVAGTYRGRDDFINRASVPLVSRLATPLVPRVQHIWAIRDRVIIRFDASATTTSGAPYRNQFMWLFRMRNGRVVEAEAFLDLAAYQAVVDNNAPRRN